MGKSIAEKTRKQAQIQVNYVFRVAMTFVCL